MLSASSGNTGASAVPDRNYVKWSIVSIASAGVTLGLLFGPAVMGVLAHDYRWTVLFAVAAPVLVAGIVVTTRRILRAIP